MGLINWISRAVYGAGGLAGLALTLLYFFQEKILYVPVVPGFGKEYQYTPDQWKLGYENVSLVAEDGVKLHAWFIYPKDWTEADRKTNPVVMFFQENAGNMAFRLPFLRILANQMKCSVFALSYRGYGGSSGRPNEAGLKLDAEAALQHVVARKDVDTSRIVLFGRSLGGAVAIHLAAKHEDKIRALVVENTFCSVEHMAGQMLPFLGVLIGPGRPANFLVTNKWNNLKQISNIYHTPLLMLTSLQDEMIPPSQMRQLWEARRTDRSEWVDFPEAHHMDAYDVAPVVYWSSVQSFLRTHVLPPPAASN